MPVGVKGWLEESANNLRELGAWGLVKSTYHVYLGALLAATTRYPIGTNIYERDWDLLIVLDACRVDAMEQVAPEYEFIGEVSAIRSVASTSLEWLAKTFRDQYSDEIRQTAYVTGNPYFEEVIRKKGPVPGKEWTPIGHPDLNRVSPQDFAAVEEVYKFGIDQELGAIPPRTMTDCAINTARKANASRLIVHYMQPHTPYLGSGLGTDVMRKFERGELSHETVWNAYLDNLRQVLDDVRLLLNNVDAGRVVITADHGEAFGELGSYGHPFGFPHPCVRRVPWVETTATDRGRYEPEINQPQVAGESVDIEEHLADLGYI